MSDEGRIARVARALCVADGDDPEAMVEIGGGVRSQTEMDPIDLEQQM